MLVAWSSGAMAAFDRMRDGVGSPRPRWAFFALLGATALAKGIGFGAVLVGSTAVAVLVWDRDRATLRTLRLPGGIALAWRSRWPGRSWSLRASRGPGPLDPARRRPPGRAARRTSRASPGGSTASRRSGRPCPGRRWPWSARGGRPGPAQARAGGPDRLLWAWAVVPAALVSLATVKNGHYLIHALPPLSVWAAMALVAAGGSAPRSPGWTPDGWRGLAAALFAALGLGWAAGFAARPVARPPGVPSGRSTRPPGGPCRPAEPLVLLYD